MLLIVLVLEEKFLLYQLILVLVGHVQAVVDHDCLEDGQRDHSLGTKESVHILKVFQHSISQTLSAFQKLHPQLCHEGRLCALLSDSISEVITGYLLALICKLIEES